MANSWYLEGPPRLHVRRLGAGDSHVVMMHGIVTGSLASWLLTSAPKVAKEHAVTLFDMRGHGLSERPPSGYRISDMLDDLNRVTEGIDRFALVGHSYGAWVSARAAERWPDRVTALFAVDPPLGSVVRDLDPEEVRPSTLRRHGRRPRCWLIFAQKPAMARPSSRQFHVGRSLCSAVSHRMSRAPRSLRMRSGRTPLRSWTVGTRCMSMLGPKSPT